MNQLGLMNVHVTLHIMITEFFLQELEEHYENLLHPNLQSKWQYIFFLSFFPLGPYSVYSQVHNQTDPGKT